MSINRCNKIFITTLCISISLIPVRVLLQTLHKVYIVYINLHSLSFSLALKKQLYI